MKRRFLQEWCDNGRYVGRWKDNRLKGVINDTGHGWEYCIQTLQKKCVGMESSSHDLGAHIVMTECK